MKIPVLKLQFTNHDIEFIKNGILQVLKSGFLTMSKKVEEFERLFAKFTGTKYAIATNSGTSALEMILRAIDVRDKTVIVPTITFMATPIAAIHAGAKVVFVDVTKEDLSIDPSDLKKKIRKDTKAVILVHIGGIISQHYYEIKKICQEKNIFLIEDAAHAHGSTIDGKMAGNLGVAGAFSFYPTKVLTTAEGGMITTNNKMIDTKAKILREHGKKDHSFNIHTEFGYNWRFSEIHALLGIQQMRKARKIINARQKIAAYYDKKLAEISNIDLIKIPKNIKSSYYKYIIYLGKGLDRQKIKAEMLKKYNIVLPGEVYSDPCHSQPVFDIYPGNKMNPKSDVFPNAKYVCSRQICLPLYPGLTKKELDYIINSFKKVIL